MKLYSHQNVPWDSREEKIENARNLKWTGNPKTRRQIEETRRWRTKLRLAVSG